MPKNLRIRSAKENRHVEAVLRGLPDHRHPRDQAVAIAGSLECYSVEGDCHDETGGRK